MIKETWKYAKATLHSHSAIASFGSPNTVYLARSCPRSTHICQKLIDFKGILANIRYTETLSDYGHVKLTKMIHNRETDLFKGFCFVEMSANSEEAEAINALNGKAFMGRQLNAFLFANRE